VDSQLDGNNTQNQPDPETVISDDIIKNNMISQEPSIASETVNESDKTNNLSTSATSEKETSNSIVVGNSKNTILNNNKASVQNNNKTTIAVTQDRLNTTDSENRTPKNKIQKNNYSSNTTKVVTNNIPQNLPEQPTKNNISEENNPLKGSTTVATTEQKTEDVIEQKDAPNKTTEEVKPSIEEAIANSEDAEEINEKEKEVKDRWSITPNVSPVYFNTLGKGSSIHGQFNNNTKSGDLNLGYGVNTSYAITDRISVRTGVNRVNVGYKTNDVVVYQNIGTEIATSNNFMRNIKLDPGAENTSIISSEALQFADTPQIVSQNFKASLNQEIAFVEVPLEVAYKVSDKKLGVNLIGGFSTMFLQNNTIYAQIRDETTPIGEANNINDVSYSANLGIGLELKVSQHVNLNFEPTFKYQINTFNNASGDFQPYILAVNSGLKFKF